MCGYWDKGVKLLPVINPDCRQAGGSNSIYKHINCSLPRCHRPAYRQAGTSCSRMFAAQTFHEFTNLQIHDHSIIPTFQYFQYSNINLFLLISGLSERKFVEIHVASGKDYSDAFPGKINFLFNQCSQRNST